jgi:S1-C subfamily serine protease
MLTREESNKTYSMLLILVFVGGLLVGGIGIFLLNTFQTGSLNNRINNLQNQLSSNEGFQNATYQTITINQNGSSLTDIYKSVSDSVVLLQGTVTDGVVQGSGFVYRFLDRTVVLTNYHVVQGTTDLSVTFSDGNGYAATVLGTDPYSDLAVVSVTGAPSSELKPINIVSSSTLSVGETVIAIGNPYGLVGSLTTGTVSALGRTISENSSGQYLIANIIQTSTPINPGNSGGPLLNSLGNVVGITTAIVTDSQGLGFAIPSNTILREIGSLISSGTYNGHSLLGVLGQDMNYDLAKQNGESVTYGWRIQSITTGGPSDGKLLVGDIIIALNNQTIRNGDDLASYLNEYTLPGANLDVTYVRGTSQSHVVVVLGQRPAVTG